jgi:hypothetical protein
MYGSGSPCRQPRRINVWADYPQIAGATGEARELAKATGWFRAPKACRRCGQVLTSDAAQTGIN